ncbi:hypothetical protein [Paenibacillus arenilitoris]|nr:hypothetical protein [Paenibacillus arenilitoris]
MKPKLGLQGPVVAWQDCWAGEASDQLMRTGTGSIYPSQDPLPPPGQFVEAMRELGAEFYVHHMFPSLAGQAEMIRDMAMYGMEVCLGNEYGNINGPYVEGTNRYDVPDEALLEAARSGMLIGLLYDEPEHLQINASQYRKDAYLPHWGGTEGCSLAESQASVGAAVAARVGHVRDVLEKAGLDADGVPLVSEFVFPTMFHALARAGMAVCPKIMKESFQSLQLSTALGAARQYGRAMWICADLWGPDAGPWFTRTSGFPGHSPEEYASALRMGYYMGPTHLFTENIDVLLRYGDGRFRKTEFGDVWDEFARGFVPEHPLTWSHRDADPDIVFIHSDDSNYGQNARLFGNRGLAAPEATQSVFHVWHLLSHGTIPAHGSCMHIPGYAFPRKRLKAEVPKERFPLEQGWPFPSGERVHPLYYPVNNVLVYDEKVRERQLGRPKLIVVAGERIEDETLKAVRRRAEAGATVVIAGWLAEGNWPESGRAGEGTWLVTDSFLTDERVMETVKPFLGSPDCWIQRFGGTEVRMSKADERGFTLDFEISGRRGKTI